MKKHTHSQQVEPIGSIVSPYREKFGIPRQPGLVEAATGYIEMLPEFTDPAAFEGLDGFSHIWITFGFHACAGEWRTRVRPPRLGGNQEVGVFASRSPFRPNNLGLSALRFMGLEQHKDQMRVHLGGLDILHGSPVYDIKPYVPYADSIADAQGGFASSAPEKRFTVEYAPDVIKQLQGRPDLYGLITQTLCLDPRPAYQQKQTSDRIYGMRLQEYDVRWQVQADRIRVIELKGSST